MPLGHAMSHSMYSLDIQVKPETIRQAQQANCQVCPLQYHGGQKSGIALENVGKCREMSAFMRSVVDFLHRKLADLCG